MNKYVNKVKGKLHKESLRRKNKNTDFTLITQNCIGGVIYNILGLEFKSPTINLFIEGENFVKLVENLEYYMSVEATPKEECYVDPIDSSISYPKIAIDDIEICCLHYKNCQEAIDAWEKRRKRVNLDNVYVIGNSWNLQDEALIGRLLENKYKTVIFTMKAYPDKRCIQLPGDEWHLDKRGIVRPNITDTVPGSYDKYFERFFDFVTWLNEK